MAITIKRSASTFHKSNPRPTDVPVGSYGARIMAAQNAAQVQSLVGPSGFKNHIINGDFRIWQRGTQGTNNTTSGIDSADRWWINKSSGTGFSERYQFTRGDKLIPGNPSYALKVTCNTGNNNCGCLQKVEDVRAFMGKTVTLSFWSTLALIPVLTFMPVGQYLARRWSNKTFERIIILLLLFISIKLLFH